MFASWYKWHWFWFRKSLILKSLETGEVSLSVCPVYIICPAHPFAHTAWERWVILQLRKVPHPTSTQRCSLFPLKATECVQPCLNIFRQLGKHTADVSSDWAKSSDVKNGSNSLEVIGVLPISATWECCLLLRPDSHTHCKHLHRKQF